MAWAKGHKRGKIQLCPMLLIGAFWEFVYEKCRIQRQKYIYLEGFLPNFIKK